MPEEKLPLKAWSTNQKEEETLGDRKCCEQEQIDIKPNPYSEEEEDEDATLTASYCQLRSSCQYLRVKKPLKIIRH
jgi:hypothetical protein